MRTWATYRTYRDVHQPSGVCHRFKPARASLCLFVCVCRLMQFGFALRLPSGSKHNLHSQERQIPQHESMSVFACAHVCVREMRPTSSALHKSWEYRARHRRHTRTLHEPSTKTKQTMCTVLLSDDTHSLTHAHTLTKGMHFLSSCAFTIRASTDAYRPSMLHRTETCSWRRGERL